MASGSFVCSVCLGPIPQERDDTIIWQDVRFAIDEAKTKDGRTGYGPFLTAHPACFQRVAGRMNAPCPTCGHPMAPIPSAVPNVGRWACGGCRREFEEGPRGELKEVAPPVPLRHRPGRTYVADRADELGRAKGEGGDAEGRI